MADETNAIALLRALTSKVDGIVQEQQRRASWLTPWSTSKSGYLAHF